MRVFAAALLLSIGCRVSELAPAPSTPPPPPERPVNVAWITGSVADASGLHVESPEIRATIADADYEPAGPSFQGVMEGGGFRVRLEDGTGPVGEQCVVVEASFGGATGRAMTRVTFGSYAPPRPEQSAHVAIRLDPAPPLTRAIGDRLVAQLVRAIGNPDEPGLAAVGRHVWGGEPAVRAAADAYRRTLGTDVRWSVVTEDSTSRGEFRRIDYRLSGNGVIGILGIEGGAVIRVHSPPLFYAARADAFVRRFFELVVRNDSEAMARLLTADDIDFPVSDARRIVESWRAEFDEIRAVTPSLLAFDEAHSTIRYRVTGTRNGSPRTRDMLLGYGDGLLWLRPSPPAGA